MDRKNGRKPIEYLHPLMEPILNKTMASRLIKNR
ncbi:MAG: hypothetical protein IPM83_10670 [Ignavibacteria bacterium]|nr:hypothetical protein [Ignavibacteria bacterium]